MKRNQEKHGLSFKAKAAMEVLKGGGTITTPVCRAAVESLISDTRE